MFAWQSCFDSEEAILSMRTDGRCKCFLILSLSLKPDPKPKPYAGLLLGELCQILVGAWWLVEEDLQSETSWLNFEDIAGHGRSRIVQLVHTWVYFWNVETVASSLSAPISAYLS